MTADQNKLLYGRAEALPERVPLRAGPLSMFFEQGDLHAVRLGATEILQRVYVAIRDRSWATAPNLIADLQIEQQEQSFRISYTAVSQLGEVDFRWRADIEGTAAGRVTWRMEGEAATSFWKNRIGWCVLHPTHDCAGRECVVEHLDGSVEHGHFPRLVSPHQPFLHLLAITHKVADGVRAQVRCAGEEFEMEDQRNWTDSSFKIYSTPQALPFPVHLPVGNRVAQTITLTLQETPPSKPASDEPRRWFNVQQQSVPLPTIGLAVANTAPALHEQEIALLRALQLAHVRLDLRLAHSSWEAALARGAAVAVELGTLLECAVFLGDDAALQLSQLAIALDSAATLVTRWLVLPESSSVTPDSAVQQARKILGPLTPQAEFAGGTDQHFAELNRNRPATGNLDAVCFPSQPQVHATDDASLIVNAAGPRDSVATARAFACGKRIIVSPVTLRSRDESAPDPRQSSLLGAAWTVASLKHLCAGGASSVTYYQTIGEHGVIETGNVYPVYHVFALLAEFRGGEMLLMESGEPRLWEGLVLRLGDRLSVLLANFSPAPQEVRMGGLPIDPSSLSAAVLTDAEGFRGQPNTGSTVLLPPFGLLRLDGRTNV